MITNIDFTQIDNEIKEVIVDSLNILKNKSEENYSLFLADACFDNNLDNTDRNPYSIDNTIDDFKDITRLNFICSFMNIYYNFPNNQVLVNNDEYRMNLELMIYTHIWESKSFLKKIFRLAHLLNKDNYEWDVKIPDMSKHTFIRKNIRKIFDSHIPKLGFIVKSGFHTSLRNAFAHSEYSFDILNNHDRINLYNYKNDDTWELKFISFDDWSKRFVYSVLLSYHFNKICDEKRKSINSDLGRSEFIMDYPSKITSLNKVKIQYNEISNSFNFKK